MKAIRSLCTISLLLAAAWSLAAQVNPWKDGDNITGIRVGKHPARQSSALLFGSMENGGFRPAFEAASFWKAGVRAGTEVHEGSVSLAGNFSFTQKEGKDMMRSMFVHPGLYPFDLIEFTPGPKTLQTYSFDGGLAWGFSERWTVGGKVRFEADNYAKRKDLRHTNYYQDITVLPAVKYSFGTDRKLHIGLNGCYRSKSESVQAEQLGASGQTYDVFLDKGMMYGEREVWDGDGVHLAEAGVNRFPVREQTWGAAIQASYDAGLYGEFAYSRSFGEVGEKGYVWMRFPGEQVTARLTYLTEKGNYKGIFRLELKSNLQHLNEFAVDRENKGGVVTPVSYTDAPKELSRRHTRSFQFRYDLYSRKLPRGFAGRQHLFLLGGGRLPGGTVPVGDEGGLCRRKGRSARVEKHRPVDPRRKTLSPGRRLGAPDGIHDRRSPRCDPVGAIRVCPGVRERPVCGSGSLLDAWFQGGGPAGFRPQECNPSMWN